MARPNLFRNEVRGGRSYSTSSSEIDLREHFDLFIYGNDKGVIAHGRPFIIRRLRRDSSGNPDYCTCTRVSQTIEPDPDCSYCQGEGYLYDADWLIGYTMLGGADSGLVARQTWMPPGAVRIDYRIFFFRYDADIKYGDKIVIPALDIEGVPVQPLAVEAVHKPQTVAEMRSDGGRLEYYTLYSREEDAVRTDVVT